MTDTSRRELVKVLEQRFGNLCRPHGRHTGPLATVLPLDADEVGFLAESVRRHSVRLSPAGTGTDPDLPEPTGETVLVGTELMCKVRFPDEEHS